VSAVGAGEANTGFGEAVHVGRVNVGIACTGHGASVLLVGDDEEDVRSFCHNKSFDIK
jgi:hypothetical protein